MIGDRSIINSFKDVGSTEEQENEETAEGGSANQGEFFVVVVVFKVRGMLNVAGTYAVRRNKLIMQKSKARTARAMWCKGKW